MGSSLSPEGIDSNQEQCFDSIDEGLDKSRNYELGQENIKKTSYVRKFNNPDGASCWLNSCLQLILTAMDHDESLSQLTSELGQELLQLQHRGQNEALDPTQIKNIIVIAEDTRIATRLSEISVEALDPIQLENQTRT